MLKAALSSKGQVSVGFERMMKTVIIRTLYVLAILLLIAIAIPSFVPSRNIISQPGCINNLRMIDSAKRSWALAEGKHLGDPPVVSELNHYIKGDTTPLCPAGGVYSYNPVGTDPTCTITNPTLHSLPKWNSEKNEANKTLDATSQ